MKLGRLCLAIVISYRECLLKIIQQISYILLAIMFNHFISLYFVGSLVFLYHKLSQFVFRLWSNCLLRWILWELGPQLGYNVLHFLVIEQSIVPVFFGLLHFFRVFLPLFLKHEVLTLLFKRFLIKWKLLGYKLPSQWIKNNLLLKFFSLNKFIFFQ